MEKVKNSQKYVMLKFGHMGENHFWLKNFEFFGSKNDFRPDDHISTWRIFASYWPFPMDFGAKDICFLWKNSSTSFIQHLVNTCCLNGVLKINRKLVFAFFFWCNKTFICDTCNREWHSTCLLRKYGYEKLSTTCPKCE